LGETVRACLRSVGLLHEDSVIEVEHPVRIRYGYPIYDHAYAQATGTIHEFLRRHGLAPAGRFGRWAYLSLEDSLLDGMRAAAECQTVPASALTG